MYRKWSTLVLLALLMPIAAWAQSTGKLTGRVSDKATGEGLPGANVIIEGTQIGTATDIDGRYTILGVPVGRYNIRASFVGFTDVTVEGVEINAGYTRELNFQLQEGQVLQDVVVEYERPLIQKDALGAPRVVSGDEIQNLPVRGVASVAAIQAGVVNSEGSGTLNVRGGRGEEVVFYVDGVKVVGSLGVAQSAVQEQEMLIGGLPARYGDAMAGVISVTTKTGATRFFGTLEGVTSQLLDAYGYNSIQGSIGGPVVGNKLQFFASAEYQDIADSSPRAIGFKQLRGDLFDEIMNNPQVLLVHDSTGAEVYRRLPGNASADSLDAWSLISQALQPGDELISATPIDAADVLTAEDFTTKSAKPNDALEALNLAGNVTVSPISPIRVRIGGQYATRAYDNFSTLRSIFNYNGNSRTETGTARGYLSWTHNLSSRTFYQVQLDYSNYQYWTFDRDFSRELKDVMFYEDIDNPANAVAARYRAPVFVTENSDGSLSYSTQGSDDDVDTLYVRQYSDNSLPSTSGVFNQYALPGASESGYSKGRTEQLSFRVNAQTQLGVHQIEFGGEYEQRTQRGFSISSGNTRYLARIYNDGKNETGTAVDTYAEIPYDVLKDRTSYYGYTYNGLKENDEDDIAGYNSSENALIAPFKPIYYAGYISDKIEYRDLTVQLGARLDVYDSNQRVLYDPYSLQPIVRAADAGLTTDIIKGDFAVYYEGNTVTGFRSRDGQFYDVNGQSVSPQVVRTSASVNPKLLEGAQSGKLDDRAFADFKPEAIFQPRIGVTFPVTDRALFFAHYDVLAQRPTTQQFTTLQGYANRLETAGSIGNPNLKPQRTTEYELGFRQRLGERAALQLSGFYRQIDDLIQLRALKNVFPNNYSTYQNVDFGTVKGVEVEFDLRRTNNVAFTANYTLSFAQGTGSDASTTSNIFWLREANPYVPNFLSPLNFDQRHTGNISIDYRLGRGEGPSLFGAKLLENFGINILGSFKSGQPYSRLLAPYPREFAVRLTGLKGQINGNNMPGSVLLNLKVDRRFNFGRAAMVAFLEVENLLDADNVTSVWQATGLPDNDGYLAEPQSLSDYPIGSIQRQYYQYRNRSPYNYGIPRQTRLGLRLNF